MGGHATDSPTAPTELALVTRRGRRGETRSLYLGPNLLKAIEQVALQEDRSISRMAQRLLIEALRARGIQVPDDGEQGDS